MRFAPSRYLKDVVTVEHYQIMGKWMLPSPYSGPYRVRPAMLIWYANIPEETQFFITDTESWWALSMLLVIGRFLLLFQFAVALDQAASAPALHRRGMDCLHADARHTRLAAYMAPASMSASGICFRLSPSARRSVLFICDSCPGPRCFLSAIRA